MDPLRAQRNYSEGRNTVSWYHPYLATCYQVTLMTSSHELVCLC